MYITFNNSVSGSQKNSVSIKNTSRVMMCTETSALCCETDVEP